MDQIERKADLANECERLEGQHPFWPAVVMTVYNNDGSDDSKYRTAPRPFTDDQLHCQGKKRSEQIPLVFQAIPDVKSQNAAQKCVSAPWQRVMSELKIVTTDQLKSSV